MHTPHISRIAQLAAAAAAGAILSAGGYALASGSSTATTIHACADRKGAHLLHLQARCRRGQRAVAWNRAGRDGAQGPPAAAAWAIVAPSGVAAPGHGLTVQHQSAGIYQITVTAASCSQSDNAPVVSISNANPPNGHNAGTFPVAWVEDNGTQSFIVNTGLALNGSFVATDQAFNVQDSCS